MGDTDIEKVKNSAKSVDISGTKPSIDILKKVEPSENIAIEPSTNISLENSQSNVLEKSSQTTLQQDKPTAEKQKVEVVEEIIKPGKAEEEKTPNEQTLKSNISSNIFNFNEDNNKSSTVFSVTGAPAKTVYNTTSDASYQTTCSTDTIKTQISTSSKHSQYRNPLTGIGVSSKDEFKSKPSKRRDGNPLLGTGYKDDDNISTGSSHRIPPGGYSNGLW